MSHTHALNVFTPDFKINAITREVIQVQPDVLITLMQYDHNSESLRFECPRFIDGHDMSLCNKVEVHFVNSDVAASVSKGGYYTVTDIAVNSSDPSLVNFSWVVSRNSTENVGTLVFSVRFICTTGDTIDYVWHTLPFTYVSVDQGLVNELDPEYQKIYLDNLETEAGKKVVEAGEATTTALEAAERASEAINDLYSMDVTNKAPAIVCEVSGEVISIIDSANMPLKGLRLFGKSIQDGTPTLNVPVEIVSVDNPRLNICGKNLLPRRESYSNNGITFTVNSDGSITINGTATASALFMFTDKITGNTLTLPKGEYVVSGIPGSSKETYYITAYDSKNTDSNRIEIFEDDNVITIKSGYLYKTRIVVVAGTTLENVTFYPMIHSKSITDSKYEPYSCQTISNNCSLHGIPVTSGGNYTDENGLHWICDELDMEHKVLRQRVVRMRVTSDLRWANSDTTAKRYVLNIPVKTNVPLICTHFQGRYGSVNTSGFAYISTSGKQIAFNTEFDTLNDWLAFIDNNEVFIIYAPAESSEISLSETEIAAYKALHTNKPNTVILNDSGAWQSVDYVADTKLYIDNKFAELANK